MTGQDHDAGMGAARSPLGALMRGPAPQGLAATGSLFGATGASACCIAPLVLSALGASGAWASAFATLAPYRSIFVGVTLAFLAAGFWMVYRRPKAACAEGSACADRPGSRLTEAVLWLSAALVAAALAFPYVAPILRGA